MFEVTLPHERDYGRAAFRQVLQRCELLLTSTKDTAEDGIPGLPDCGDSIDQITFSQILEMDDDEDEREFSKSIVYGFFEQAESTFQKMDANLYLTPL